MLVKILIALALTTSQAQAALVKKSVDYKDGSQSLQGWFITDDSVKGPHPGVLVVHDWMGLSDENIRKATDVAKLGYNVFMADIYGVGNAPKNQDEAAKLAGSYKADRKKLRARVNAALAMLEKQAGVDTKHIAAIGYCFGGTTVLELGRSGAKLNSIVSFHGGLDSPTPADGKNFKAHVLVLHGADDPFSKPADVAAFQDELRKNKVDWQMNLYGGAVHSFTDKGAGNDNSKGAAYNAEADRRSWQAMQDFFKETL